MIKKHLSILLLLAVISFTGLFGKVHFAEASCNPVGNPPANPPDITSITNPNGTYTDPTSIPVVINGQGGYQCTGDPNGGLGWDDVATSVLYVFTSAGNTVYYGVWNTTPCTVPICVPRTINVNTNVNSASWPAGSYTMTATATGPDDLEDTMSVNFDIVRTTPPGGPTPVSGTGSSSLAIYDAPDVSFLVDGVASTTVNAGRSVTLSWTPINTSSGSACIASGSWSGNKASTPGQTYSELTAALTAGSYSYSIKCYGGPNSTAESLTKTVYVTVTNNAPTATITCNGVSTSCNVAYLATPTIVWSSTNATSCTVSPTSWTGTSGSRTTNSLTSNVTYSVSCAGPGGSANASVNVVVGANADIFCNGAWPSCSIAYGASATISWTSSNATSCSVTPGGWTTFNGTQSTGALTTTTTYSITCTNSAGSSNDSVTVNVGSQPDFTVSCAPATQTIVAGSTTSYNITTAPLNGFSSSVVFSEAVEGGGKGRTSPTVSYTNNNQVPAATTVAIVSTSGSTTPGTYTINFTGVGGGQSHSCQSQVTVDAASGIYSLNITPASQSVNKGGQAIYTVTTTCTSGYNGTVSFVSLIDLHPGATYEFRDGGPNGPIITNLGTCSFASPAVVSLVINTTSANNSTLTRTFQINASLANGTTLSGTAQLTINDAVPVAFNLTSSDKDIVKVNGVDNDSVSSCSGSGDVINKQFGLIKTGDILTFKISLCNSGDLEASINEVVDDFTNLTRPTAGWNAKYTDANGAVDIDSGEIAENQDKNGVITGITFSFNKAPKVIPARDSKGSYSIGSITFNAQVANTSSTASGIFRFQNRASVYETGGSVFNLSTPLLLFTSGPAAPDLKEVAP